MKHTLLRRKRKLNIAQFKPLPSSGYLIGGALRDVLLKRKFTDIDWLVKNPQKQAHRAAHRLKAAVFPLDRERGHWRVKSKTMIRDYIRLDEPLEDNLSKRDFSVNAMALSLENKLIDPFDGLKDLAKKRIRMLQENNLFDDPIRCLRAVRLAYTLGFSIELLTVSSIEACSQAQAEGRLALPTWERIREELSKLILLPNAGQGFRRLDSLSLLELYLPELTATQGVEQGGFHHLDVFYHSLEALNQLVQGFPDADLPLRWATLLHDIGKPESQKDGHFYGHDKLGAEVSQALMKRLSYPKQHVKRTSDLVRYHMVKLPKNEKEARRFVHRRRELLPDLLKLMIADREAARGPRSTKASRQAYRLALAKVLKIMAEKPPKPPLLNGKEIKALLKQESGPHIGEALAFLKEAEAVGDISNKEEAAKALSHYAKAQGWVSIESFAMGTSTMNLDNISEVLALTETEDYH